MLRLIRRTTSDATAVPQPAPTRRLRRAQRRAQRHGEMPRPTRTGLVFPAIRAARSFVTARMMAKEQDGRRVREDHAPDAAAQQPLPVVTPPHPIAHQQQQTHVPAQPREAPPRVQYPEALPGVAVNYTQDTVEGLAIVGCQHHRTPEVQQSEAALLHDLADLLEPVTPNATRPKDAKTRVHLPAGVDVGIVPNENLLDASGNPVRAAPPSAPNGSDHTGRVLNRGYIVVTDDFARSNPALNVSEAVTMYQTAFDGAPLPLAVDPIRGEASMEVERYVARAAEDYRPVFRRRDSWRVYGRATYQTSTSL